MSTTTEIAERLKGLREMMDISTAEMAQVAGIDEKTYLDYEAGKKDFSVTLLYNCAGRFGVDVTALLTGHTPTLSSYSIVRAGQGVPCAEFPRQNGGTFLRHRALRQRSGGKAHTSVRA